MVVPKKGCNLVTLGSLNKYVGEITLIEASVRVELPSLHIFKVHLIKCGKKGNMSRGSRVLNLCSVLYFANLRLILCLKAETNRNRPAFHSKDRETKTGNLCAIKQSASYHGYVTIQIRL